MGRLIPKLKGGTRDPSRPGAGEGGYTYPRGPMGQTGFPGSTPQAQPTKSQLPGDGTRKLGRDRKPRGRANITFRDPDGSVGPDSGGGQGLQQDVTANQAAWAAQPPRMLDGQPLQPPAMIKGTGTEADRDYSVTRHIAATAPALGVNVPGGQNIRNQRYYGGPMAAPGMTSSPAYNGGGPYPAPAQPFVDPLPEAGSNRYSLVPGEGYQSWEVERIIPFHIHARPPEYRGAPSNRGADLSGERATWDTPIIQANATAGRYGYRRAEGPRHRPTTFTQPAPWTVNYYDTSAAEQQGTQTQAGGMVHVSAAPARSSVTGRGSTAGSGRRRPRA